MDTLAHYGVKGMRQGVRKTREERNAERRAKYEKKLKDKYGDYDVSFIEDQLKKRKAQADKLKQYKLANQRNRQLTAAERREKYYNSIGRGSLGKTYAQDTTLAEAARKYYAKGHNRRMSHSDELAHYGVKGMRWGVRRRARKDAKEFTQAKMYYGEGAGNRRKLIKATVKARSKDPFYKSEFNKAVASTDMAKRASQARRQRGRKNVRNSTGKTVRGVGNIASGNVSRAGGALALGYLGYQAAKRTGHAPSEGELLRRAAVKARKIKRVVQHDDVLAHYGVKGMRWGVRKAKDNKGRKWMSKKNARIKGMSDEELRRANNRLRLEREYRDLTKTKIDRYRSKAAKAAEDAVFEGLKGALAKGVKKGFGAAGSASVKGAKRFKHSDTEAYLAHYGVKGMRRGIRKQREKTRERYKRAGLTGRKWSARSKKEKALLLAALGASTAYSIHTATRGRRR